MELPPFNLARGASILTSTPPYDFEGVTARIFPIKANIYRLRKFCQCYYNVMPPEIAHFEPALPFVLGMVLNYGKLSQEASNAGWVSQNEVLFGALLEWYRKENGKYVFKDWALGCPFIFVDDEQSLTTGREVYGWPKVKAWLDAGVSPWALHPRLPRRLMSLKTRIFPRMSAGVAQKPCTLIEIFQHPSDNVIQAPPELRGALNPLLAIPDALLNTAKLAGDLAEILLRPKLLGYRVSPSVRSLGERLSKLLSMVNVTRPDLYTNCINLKQFRDTEEPTAACYQALTNSRMELNRFNRAGLLGERNILRGDFSGGYRLRIHKYDSQPIIESMGLEVEGWGDGGELPQIRGQVTEGPLGNTRLVERERHRDRQENPPTAASATFKPVFPFWCDLDMRYSLGAPIAWRTRHSRWYAAEGDERKTRVPKIAVRDDLGIESDAGAEGEPRAVEVEAVKKGSQTAAGEALYDTARGAAGQAVSGPFRFPNTTMRVFPLLADPAKLAAFCDAYLNIAPEVCSFEPWGTYVYLVVTNYGEMASESNNVGWWADRDLAFTIPLKWKDAKGKLISLAMVTPFIYSDSGIATTSGREVFGWPITKAAIESPPDAWMSEGGASPDADRQLVSMTMRLIPALEIGLGTQERVVLEIIKGDALPYNDPIESREVAGDWGFKMIEDYYRKVALADAHPDDLRNLKAMALDPIACQAPLHSVNLKQFRHSSHPDKACYQALVLATSHIDFIDEIREIEENVHIRIHRYPTQPIVDMLGLVVKKTDISKSPFPGRAWDGAPIDYLQPIRPFWMKLKLRADLGKNLCWRADSKTWSWHGSLPGPFYFEKDEPVRVGPQIYDVFRTIQDARMVPKIVTKFFRDQVEGAPVDVKIAGARFLDRADARRAVETLEPQMAIESILSDNLLNLKPSEIRKPDFCLRWGSAGILSDDLLFQISEGNRMQRRVEWRKEGDWVWLKSKTPQSQARTALVRDEDTRRQQELIGNLTAHVRQQVAEEQSQIAWSDSRKGKKGRGKKSASAAPSAEAGDDSKDES